jgi:hypothetical protein
MMDYEREYKRLSMVIEYLYDALGPSADVALDDAYAIAGARLELLEEKE